ncbi:LIM and SH3 domain protein F42H10.3-like isoform X3 [Babylonia areolata]|uniref:LIM and SH3 domain protein F42H10.3-like isoform X3 n=1 Tax=Babylonia areolata TaxID=304850 RepID=UPI003FD06F93
MSKKCAKCTKTVYPTEELKCLDKIWHKACFKCEVCGMTLNMKNYKGYDKLPYCNAHYPTTKHTQVADTPESRRIAENTKIQSQVQYHAEFEKQKGHKTSVADDPETARIKQNTAIQSNINYWGVRELRSAMEERRPQEAVDDVSNSGRRQPGSISDYDPMNQQFGSVAYHPEPVRQPQPAYQPPPPQPQQPQRSRGMVCKAMYDYQAADTDEVSFSDGDIIIECQPVDAGWMTGRVERTGQYGMLPSNYVERIN